MATTRTVVIKGGFVHPSYTQTNVDRARTAMVVTVKSYFGSHVKSR
jgi:hypothetical protein